MGFAGVVAKHPVYKTLDPSGFGDRRLFTLLALSPFSLAFALFLWLYVGIDDGPKALEKVVERTDARKVVKIEAAKNGVNGSDLQDIDPCRESLLWITHEVDEVTAEHRSGVFGLGTAVRIGILK